MGLSARGLAARQLADYHARTPGTFFAEEAQPRLTLDDAYAVQAEVAELRAARGEQVAYEKRVEQRRRARATATRKVQYPPRDWPF